MEPVLPSLERSSISVSLPVYLTRFVGREEERARLATLVINKRLLTLIGVGGIGKTRLALEVAANVVASFPDGVYMVELASLSEPQLITLAIASALGIRTDQDIPLLSHLISALGQRHVLLLLDNCEHVLAQCAPLVEALLHGCPQLHILATSRESFAVTGETVWRVVPLPSPSPEEIAPIERLSNYEAIQLFCERAGEAHPNFRLTSHNASAIVRICHQLDGLPLALELAAALLPVLSVEQLAARLDERFVLLKYGKRTASVRQQTLQATLDWSYSLLTLAEQAVFQRLAVFSGSWTLDAVEQICALPDISPSAIFDVLVRLVNKSLVIAEEQESREEGTAEVRYRLLDTIRQYAQEQLRRAGLWQQLCEQHARWYLHLAEQASKQLHGPDQLVWLYRLEVEMTNMHEALSRLLTVGNLHVAAQLADALRLFWITRNHFGRGRYWFEALLAQESDDQRLAPPLRARILFGASEFARYQGDYDRACSLLEEQLALLTALGDELGRAEAQVYLGLVRGLRGDDELAIQLCQTCLAFYREAGHQTGITTTLTTLAFVRLAQGNTLQAIALSEEACHLLRQAGNSRLLLYVLFTLAQAALFQSAVEQARAACQEALHLAQAQQHTYGLAASLGLIGGLAGLQGQPIQAARLFGAAQTLQERVQVPHPPAGRALLERMVLAIRTTLGAQSFLSHYSAGRVCPLEQILGEAEALLQPISASSSPGSSTPAISPALAVLSRREREVLALVTMGLTDAQVAQSLQLSPRTVSKHLQSIYTKLNINSRSAATRIALEEGLM
jgi:non-specific serine/threonine protein kinase